MAIFFKTVISDSSAFELIEHSLSGQHDYDGYLNIADENGERTVSWNRGMLAEEFKDHVTDALRTTWDAARFWVVYERRDDRNDAGINEIRNAAVKITRGYPGTIVVTLSLLGRRDNDHDIELVFVCFTEDFHRRNFRVRYEGKFVPV